MTAEILKSAAFALGLFLLLPAALLIQSGGAAKASGQVIATYRSLASGQQEIIGQMKVNLAQKKEFEKQYKAVETETARYDRDVAEASAFCEGSFEPAEYQRRLAICEAKQKDLDARAEASAARQEALDAHDAERRQSALQLKADYDALGKSAKEIEATMAGDARLASLLDTCREHSGLAARATCLEDNWAPSIQGVTSGDASVVDLSHLDMHRPIAVLPKATGVASLPPDDFRDQVKSSAISRGDQRTKWLLDSLEAGNGSWQASLDFLDKLSRRFPDNLAIADAGAMMLGMYVTLDEKYDRFLPSIDETLLDADTLSLVWRAYAKLDLAMVYSRGGPTARSTQEVDAAVRLFEQAHDSRPGDAAIRAAYNYYTGVSWWYGVTAAETEGQ